MILTVFVWTAATWLVCVTLYLGIKLKHWGRRCSTNENHAIVFSWTAFLLIKWKLGTGKSIRRQATVISVLTSAVQISTFFLSQKADLPWKTSNISKSHQVSSSFIKFLSRSHFVNQFTWCACYALPTRFLCACCSDKSCQQYRASLRWFRYWSLATSIFEKALQGFKIQNSMQFNYVLCCICWVWTCVNCLETHALSHYMSLSKHAETHKLFNRSTIHFKWHCDVLKEFFKSLQIGVARHTLSFGLLLVMLLPRSQWLAICEGRHGIEQVQHVHLRYLTILQCVCSFTQIFVADIFGRLCCVQELLGS